MVLGSPRVRTATSRRLTVLALVTAWAVPTVASAAEPALRLGVFASDDADDTSVVRTSVGALFSYSSPDRYQGLVLEDVRIRPTGGERWDDQRTYYAFAAGDTWKWTGQVGTDGDTLLGSVSTVRQGAVRQEYFAERDILETARGVDGLYYTFVGAAYDIPLAADERYQITAMAGAQAFSGDNLRSHLRGRYIAVLKQEWGLSAQLRTRAFHNSAPFEYDYYSPRWFVEAMPTVQVRRFHGGWMYAAALGWGRQRDSESGWRDARLVEASVTSPRVEGRSYLRVNASYSNTPIGVGTSYGYRQLMLEWIRPL